MFKKVLKKFGKRTKKDIVDKIESEGLVKTGKLKRSIDFKIDDDNITFEMVDYGKFLDEGTKHIDAYNFFEDIIQQNSEEIEDDIRDAIQERIEKMLTK